MPIRIFPAMAALMLVFGCHEKGERTITSPLDHCAHVGERLRQMTARIIVFSDIQTHVRLEGCSNEMYFHYVGPASPAYRAVKDRARREETVIGLTAKISGLIATGDKNRPIFVDQSIENLREDPSVQQKFNSLKPEAKTRVKRAK